MTARLLVAALALVALVTQPVAFDLPGLKQALFLAATSLLLLLPAMQSAFVRTLGGGARRVVLVAGAFAVAAAAALGTRGLGTPESVLVLRALLELLLFALVVVLARDVTWERGETLLNGLLAVGGVIGALAVAQVLGFDPIYGERSLRVPVATFGNTNSFAAFAAPCLAVAFARGARRRAFLPWLVAALLTAALVLARARGAWIAAAAGVACAALVLKRRNFAWRPPAYALGAGVMLGLLVELAAVGTSELGDKPLGLGLERTSNRVRLEVALATLDLVGEQPLLGVGPGRFRAEFPRVRREVEAKTKTREGAASEVDHPHDELLRLLAEGGALTAALALLAAFGAAAALARAERATRGDDGTAKAALAGGGAAWLVAALFWSTLHDPATALLGALLAGAALAAEVEVAQTRPRERPLALLGALALVAAALWFAVPALRAELLDWEAARDGKLDAHDLDELERAAELDRFHVERQYAIGRQFLAAARLQQGSELQLQRARSCFRQALALVPNHVASLDALAEVEARGGDDRAARAALARAHALEPWRGPVDPVLADLFAWLGRELAAARTRLAAEGDAAIAPLFAQAKALRASGKNRPAAQVLDLIAPRRPEDGELWRELSLALQDLGDDSGFRRAARQSQIAFALAALTEGRSEEARANLDVARRHALSAQGATALEELLEACVELQRNRIDEARAQLEGIDAIAARAAVESAPPTALRFFKMLAANPALAAQAQRLGL